MTRILVALALASLTFAIACEKDTPAEAAKAAADAAKAGADAAKAGAEAAKAADGKKDSGW